MATRRGNDWWWSVPPPGLTEPGAWRGSRGSNLPGDGNGAAVPRAWLTDGRLLARQLGVVGGPDDGSV
jgi:hypothetical protein